MRHAERGRERAVDSVSAAIVKRPKARSRRAKGIHVAHGHSVGDKNRRLGFGQIFAEKTRDLRLRRRSRAGRSVAEIRVGLCAEARVGIFPRSEKIRVRGNGFVVVAKHIVPHFAKTLRHDFRVRAAKRVRVVSAVIEKVNRSFAERFEPRAQEFALGQSSDLQNDVGAKRIEPRRIRLVRNFENRVVALDEAFPRGREMP